jgi:enoyl-CoA hydratase/carnithine racemase
MADQRVTLERRGRIGLVTIKRPEKLNALDIEILEALDAVCGEIEKDRAINAVVITGDGKAFSAGGDIKAWSAMTPSEFGYDWVRFGHRVFARMAELRVPVVAALNGHALGGGLELAACADLRIAEPQIKLGLPETGIGMVPGWSGTQRLVQRFGGQIVRRMAMGGEIFTAEQGLRLGLVDQVAEVGKVVDTAMCYADRIASRGPAATQVVKLLIASATGESSGTSVETIAAILVANTEDLKEGVAAFTEKRSPNFKGDW